MDLHAMDWTVMADPSPSQVPPNGTLEAPLPPVRGFFFSCVGFGRRSFHQEETFSFFKKPLHVLEASHFEQSTSAVLVRK
jgi:hypothetical protein